MDTLKQMKKISIIWGIIIFIMFASLITLSLMYKQKIKKYDELSLTLETNARKYITNKSLYPLQGGYIKVILDQLDDEGIKTELKIGKEYCDGYVIVKYDGEVISYKPYLKCLKYTSKNYNKY